MSLPHLREKLRRSAPGRLLLCTLTGLYSVGVVIRNLLYRLHLLPSWKLKARTICIGNLTTGGTGKTSAVLLAAQTLHKKQIKTAILTRGYARLRAGKDVQVLLNSQDVPWAETGDEPWMMHRALKGMEVPILISPNRYMAGETALTYYNPRVLLLDDGFQHRRLRRDLDIVLINSMDPFGGGRLLPGGNLREPLSSLKRAGLVVLTHTDQVSKERLDVIRGEIAEANAEVKILESVHRADFLLDLKTDRRRRLSYLKNKPVCCFSAIGDPTSFEELLVRTNAHIIQKWRYRDHHPYTLPELRSIENVRNGVSVVTTFKDLPRLPAGWREVLGGEVLALGVRLEITRGKSAWEEALCGEPSGNRD